MRGAVRAAGHAYSVVLGGTRWYVLAFALVNASFLFTERRWVGERGWTLDWAAGGTFISGPLLAGLTCYLAYPLLNPVARRAFGLSRPGTALRAVGVALARGVLVGWIGHGLTILGAVLATELTRPTDTYHLGFAAVCLVPLTFYAAIGVLAATVLGRTVAAVTATLASLVVGYLGLFGTLPNVLAVGGHVGSLVGYRYDTSVVLLSQSVVGAWTILVAAVTVAVVHGHRLVRPTLAVCGAAAVLATVAALSAGVSMEGRVVLAADPPPRVCDEGSPRVCLNAGHTRSLSTVARDLRTAHDALAASGADLPEVYAERPPERGLERGVGVIDLNPGSLNAARFDAYDYAFAVAVPGDCQAYRAERPPEELLLVQQYVAAWVLRELTGEELLGPGTLDPITDEWMRLAVDDLRGCDVSPSTLAPIS